MFYNKRVVFHLKCVIYFMDNFKILCDGLPLLVMRNLPFFAVIKLCKYMYIVFF